MECEKRGRPPSQGAGKRTRSAFFLSHHTFRTGPIMMRVMTSVFIACGMHLRQVVTGTETTDSVKVQPVSSVGLRAETGPGPEGERTRRDERGDEGRGS